VGGGELNGGKGTYQPSGALMFGWTPTSRDLVTRQENRSVRENSHSAQIPVARFVKTAFVAGNK